MLPTKCYMQETNPCWSYDKKHNKIWDIIFGKEVLGMSIKAYVIIEAQASWADDVINQISVLPNVKSADSITGPYDGIADVEVPDLVTLSSLVGEMNSIQGIIKTMTCLRMKFPRAPPKREKG